jgi:hypothetical protein
LFFVALFYHTQTLHAASKRRLTEVANSEHIYFVVNTEPSLMISANLGLISLQNHPEGPRFFFSNSGVYAGK